MARIGLDARLVYYRHGGISQYIYSLIDHLPQIDETNQYVIAQSRKDGRTLGTAFNQKKLSCWTPSHHRLERLAFAAELIPMRLNLLHSPDFIPPLKLGWRSVITIHDLTFLHYPQFLTAESRRYYNDQIGKAVRAADYIMVDSEATRVDILNLLNVPSEKVRTVWLGVSEHFHPASQNEVKEMRVRHDLPETYILFLGTLEPRKNLDGLLRAYQVLRAEYNDPPPLLIVGQRGWLFDDLFSLAKDLQVNDHILWREAIPYQDLPALYSGAALLCLPSHYEGFGFPPLEAMACGTPVIVANRASLPEIVGEAALLVEPDAPADIASAISRLLGDSELAMSLRARGLERVRLFDWTETARQALTVYQHVLDNS